MRDGSSRNDSDSAVSAPDHRSRPSPRRFGSLLPVAGALALIGAWSTDARAALIDMNNGLVLDTSTGLRWAKDANLALSNSFGVAGIDALGAMSWGTAQSFIAALNQADYLGFDSWRLPTVSPINGVAFNLAYSEDGSTDVGRRITSPASEWSHLYTSSLGNTTTGFGGTPVNTGPFVNLRWVDVNFGYWTGTDYPDGTGAFNFETLAGVQFHNGKNVHYFVLPVLSAEAPTPVTEPEAIALLGIGAIGLAMVGRWRVLPTLPA
jgi:hypothetical protein